MTDLDIRILYILFISSLFLDWDYFENSQHIEVDLRLALKQFVEIAIF